ncbi:endonuclease domain-containing protein [Curtobacterium sp. ISL-83]|uniref:endonuclease domain-containing protein n=1 Tax=Curtobacterium sp. ISL-83 TaxID=2819145 RepID=UPI001BE98C1A|nr:endonuclease domain-containing protein [Curtobacterium sp. ISL-83]MBT2501847.1 hypothetical protein [Curtobacterium sp. ISL-83]
MYEALPVLRASTMREAGLSGSALRRRVGSDGPGRLVRVGPNAFVRGADWDAATPRRRYVTRVYARLGRLSTRAVASHTSALAIHGLPSLHGWLGPVHASVPASMYRTRTPGLVLHTRPVPPAERRPAGTISVTTVPRTVIDIALTGDVRSAVMVADAALRNGTRRAELDEALDQHARTRSTARLVLDLADGRAASPAESLARVVFRELGLPVPVLQQEFVVAGRRFAVDFWFPEQGVVIEVDGRVKYDEARYRNGRTPTQVFLDEKRRHELLLTVPGVRRIIRLEWRDLWDLDALALRLRSAGLPCVVRPVRSARG